MNFVEWIPYIFLAVAVMVIVAVPVLGTGSLLLIRQLTKRELLPLMFWLIGLLIVIGPLQSGRNLSGMAAMFEVDPDVFANSLWINRMVSLGFVVIAAERLLRWAVTRERRQRQGLALLLALIFYSFTNHFLNAWLGTVPSFSHQALYALLLMMAAYLVANEDYIPSVLAARNVIFVVLVLSAIAAAVKPELVLQTGYAGGFFPIRYWGLGTHANVLSPLSVLLIGILLVHPFRSRWINHIALALSVISLVATQSKTSIVGAVVVVAVLAFYRYRGDMGRNGVFARPVLPVLLIIGLMSAALALLVLQLGFDIFDRLVRFFGSTTGVQVASFSNRDIIWSHALREWHENPYFGFGPAIFDARYRIQIGLSQAFHAHNQFIQSLGAGGYFGLFGLSVYVSVLAVYAWKVAESSRGLSVAIFAFILLRSVTEIPLSLRAASSAEFLIHVTLFMLCIGGYKSFASVRPTNVATVMQNSNLWESNTASRLRS